VKDLFTEDMFAGLGPSRFRPEPEAACRLITGPENRKLRLAVRRESPRSPGIYAMLDARGEIIYVGKAKNLRTRLLSYFRPGSRPPKAIHILRDAHALVWEQAADEFAALLRELELIRRFKPHFNVQGQPRRMRRLYVCVGRHPAPYVFLASRPPSTAFEVFGPVSGGRLAGEAVRRLNDCYRLRDCSQAQEMVFAPSPGQLEQGDLFPVVLTPGCLRLEIGTCLGPCAAACSREQYQRNVDTVLSFLRGEDLSHHDSCLETLQRRMEEAAAAMQFERAASLRDQVTAIGWLHDRLGRLRRAMTHSLIYPVRGYGGTELWYLIERGRVLAVLPRPADASEAVERIEAEFFTPRNSASPLTPDDLAYVFLVDSWFRLHPGERERGICSLVQ
jgi:excinuclease ABC subunit C